MGDFRCPVCGAEFETQAALDEHIANPGDMHTQKDSFRCPHCGAEFETQAALDEHIKLTHPM